MISLILTLALTLLSFVSSTFVLIRIVMPILPPNPLSRKVPPSEFGLPNYRSLSPADKSHIWLACMDLLALGFFVWQAVVESLSASPNFVHDPLTAARLWIALTTRQTCLLFIASLALLYVRLGRSVSFGPKHCLLWVPVLVCVATGTGVGVVLAQVGTNTLWGGLVAYSSAIAVLTTFCLACLVGTLLLIRHNVSMAAQAEMEKDWPPLTQKMARHSITTEDLEALKEGSSWITSHRSSSSSRRNSISAFSFSTVHGSQPGTTAPVTGSAPSVLPKSSYWFGTATPNSAALISQESIPPVPRVPSPYRERAATPPPHPVYGDLPEDPFHRSPPRPSKSSGNSWLTSPSISQVTLTEFSFPTTRPSSPNEHEQLARTALSPTVYDQRPSQSQRGTTTTQPLAESRVLGGYGRQDGPVGLSPKAKKDVDVSVFRCVAWTTSIWIPLGLSLPYLLLASPTHQFSSPLATILLTLSVTLSSPLLALNLLLHLPLPIPAALFSPSYTSSNAISANASSTEIRIHPEMRGRSSSLTVVEGRRSGDVWISTGEAVDGRGKAARVLGLLVPTPRLAVLPPEEDQNVGELTPPLPIQNESAASIAMSSPSANSAELGAGRVRKDSKASSYWSGVDESLAYNSRIMVAQRHYSAMATTVLISPSDDKRISSAASGDSRRSSVGNGLESVGISTGAQPVITKGHMRSKSASSSLQTPRTSTQNRFPLTPPPSSPLPPTPPNVRHLQHLHSQSSSGSGFSFGPIGHTNQIDSLSAGVLPLLVPGLTVGKDMVIKDASPSRHRNDQMPTRTPPKDFELGLSSSPSFNSPEIHSTPARPRKGSGHKWKHFSLPSLGLGKDGVHSLSAWKEELVRVLDGYETKTPQTRSTIHGGTRPVPRVTLQKTSSGTLNDVTEEDNVAFGYAVTSDNRRPASERTLGPTPPTSASVYSDGFNTARSSMATMVDAPTSATTLPRPTFHDQQDHISTTTHRRTPSQTETIFKAHSYHLPIPPVRQSSIVYIKSDIASDAVSAQNETHTQPPRRPQPWPRRVSVKQYIPGTSKTSLPAVDGSPLRKLTLLGNRDLNSTGSDASTRPSAILKKTKRQGDKENSGSGLRPLRLARSATAKARGLLRQDEVLPDVVVRPPSTSTHTSFGYTFR